VTMFEQQQELTRRVAAIENERARNITALVEQGAEFERRIKSLEGDVKHAVEEEGLLRRIEALEQWRGDMRENGQTPYTAYSELHNRMTTLEARLPAPIPVVDRDYHCVQCGGPVEPERHCYAHPTCYRCLPPPEPLPINLPASMRPVAPAPDYAIEREPEKCSCEESEALRESVAQAEVDAKHDGESVLAMAQALAEATARLERETGIAEAYRNGWRAVTKECDAANAEIAAKCEVICDRNAEIERLRAELDDARLLLGSWYRGDEPKVKTRDLLAWAATACTPADAVEARGIQAQRQAAVEARVEYDTLRRLTNAETRMLTACKNARIRVVHMGGEVNLLTQGSQQEIANAALAWREEKDT
jgi:hypothetical protein